MGETNVGAGGGFGAFNLPHQLSFRLDAGISDHVAPQLDLVVDFLAELFGCVADNLEPLTAEHLADLWIL
jgi:hypothetical protein